MQHPAMSCDILLLLFVQYDYDPKLCVYMFPFLIWPWKKPRLITHHTNTYPYLSNFLLTPLPTCVGCFDMRYFPLDKSVMIFSHSVA